MAKWDVDLVAACAYHIEGGSDRGRSIVGAANQLSGELRAVAIDARSEAENESRFVQALGRRRSRGGWFTLKEHPMAFGPDATA
jgi:hypothetical protein